MLCKRQSLCSNFLAITNCITLRRQSKATVMQKGLLTVENQGYPASYRVVVSVHEKALILNRLLWLRYWMSERSKQFCLI